MSAVAGRLAVRLTAFQAETAGNKSAEKVRYEIGEHRADMIVLRYGAEPPREFSGLRKQAVAARLDIHRRFSIGPARNAVGEGRIE